MSAVHLQDHRRIMDERAHRLATRKSQQERRKVAAEVVVVQVGKQRFGVPVESIAEIVRRPPLTPLPGLPAWLPGLAVVRGRLFSVVDLGRWLGVTAASDPEPGYLTLLEAAGGRPLGVLVNGVEGFREIHADEVAGHLTEDRREGRRPVSLTTTDLVAVLDLARLVDDPDISRSGDGG